MDVPTAEREGFGLANKLRCQGTAKKPVGGHRRTPELLEEDVVRQLQVGDLPGAKKSTAALIDPALEHVDDPAVASYILYDILSRVDRAIATRGGIPGRGLARRSEVIQWFVASVSRRDLLSAFWVAFDHATAPLRAVSATRHPAVEHVKLFVEENYSRKLSLAEIALEVKVSRNYLSHLFKQHCGLTVTEFLHRTRLKEAERLLLGGKRSVSEIAYLVGYQNYRDFHRNFVKHAKTSPKRFRQSRSVNRNKSAALMS